MRLATLAALLAALAAAAAASAVAKDQASAFSCKGGVSARVGGKAVCLKPGAVCKTRFQATYRAHKLICVAGHLRRMAVPKPKPPPPPPPPPPLAPGSARTAPAPLGTPLTVAREFSSDKTWQVKVVAVNTNAWPVVQAANEFNDPPASGDQDVMVTIAATYTGPGSDTAWLGLNDFSLVGASNIAYSVGLDTSCGVLPNSLLDVQDVFSGGSFQANVCWKVHATDIPTMEMYWGGAPSPGPWFALR